MLTKETDPEPQPGTSAKTIEDFGSSQEHSKHNYEQSRPNNEQICPYLQSLMTTALMDKENLNRIFRHLNSESLSNAAMFVF